MIPIESKEANASIFIIFGKTTEGLTVLSTERSKPILLILFVLIRPIDVLDGSKIAFLPPPVVIVVIPGRV